MAVKSKAKKKWMRITALSPFNEQFIGETLVSDAEDAFGKKIKLSLMNLTNDPKRQNINIKFDITKRHGDGVGAEVVGYGLVNSSVKRFVRRDCNRIDDSYIVKTKDNKKIKIKPLILTRSLTKGSVLNAIRKAAKKFILDEVSKLDYEMVVNNLLHYKLQKDLREQIRKIYPVKVCEIRVMELVKEKKKETLEKKEEPNKEVKIDKPDEKAEAEKEEQQVKEKKEDKKADSEEKPELEKENKKDEDDSSKKE